METLSIVVIVVIVALFLGLMGFKLYSNIKLKGLRQTAIDLIVAAEHEFEQGQNSEKMDYVYNALVAFIPAPFRIFITKETVIAFIQKIFDEIKIALDYREEGVNE